MVIPSYAELRAQSDAPPGASWRVFGDGDQHGTLSFLTADRVVAARESVQRGAVFNLDHALDAFPGPARFRLAPRHEIFPVPLPEPGDVLDDRIHDFHPQASSHIDALRHCRHPEFGYYGGTARSALNPGAGPLGVDRWAERGIVGRGVLIDVARHRERQGRPLDHAAEEAIDVGLLEETLAAQGTTRLDGDMVLVRTGAPDHIWSHQDDDAVAMRNAGLARSLDVVAWLWDSQVALVASDNLAVESMGSPSALGEGYAGSLHNQLIPLLGMVLGELWNLDALAEDCATDGRYDFMLVVSPLLLRGGVGSPANATAIK